MDSYTIDTIKRVSNTEVIRRLLIKYFMDKGFTESFDRQMYPGLIQDLPIIIPMLANKVEITPFAENIDTSMGKATIGWNMFILGNQRMFLGETYHNNLKELARQIQGGLILPESESAYAARYQTTPRRIVAFVTRVLGDRKAGYVDLIPGAKPAGEPGQQYGNRNSMNGMPQQFFTRSGFGV